MIALLLSPLPLASTGGPSPSPAIGFVLQLAALFGAVGGLVALRARTRWPGVDAARIAQAWAALGFVVGAAIVAARAAIGLFG